MPATHAGSVAADLEQGHEQRQNALRGATVLVTGATGFIGGRLVHRLATMGAVVHAVSRQPPPAPRGGPTWHTADLGDQTTTNRLIDAVGPDAVFHLASKVSGARNRDLIQPTLASNLLSVVNVLTAASRRTGTKVVLAGSVEEQIAAGAPVSPYAAAKRAATGYAQMFHALWDTPTAVLRVAMAYGPGQHDLTKLVPYVTVALLRGTRPELTSGTRVVDWVYVDDVVDAFVAAAVADSAIGSVVDIGTGRPTTIRRVAELISETVHGEVGPVFGAIPERTLDETALADPTAAADLLGWRPNVGLTEGIRRTVRWYAEQLAAGRL